MTPTSDPLRTMLRRIIASLAYRAAKTVRDVPATFATYRLDAKSRTSTELLAHMGDLFDWSLSMVRGQNIWHESTPLEWEHEVDRFYESLKKFDEYIASDAAIACSLDRLFQGPIADAFTHVGQLAMMRRLSGAPIIGENYFKADIVIGRVGVEQSKPRRIFG